MKKKFAAIVLASVMVSSLMTGCGAAKAPETEQTDVTEDVTENVTEESTQEVTEPEEEETGEVPDTEDHEVTTDISGCDTFTQIVDKLGAGKGYTNVNIGGTDVLLVASGVYEWEEGVFGAIDCEIFAYDDNDGIKYLGYAECGGTAYPLAVKDGYLYCGGNHFVRVFTVKNGELVLVEEAIEGFTEDGKPSIECMGGEEAPHGKLVEEPQKMLDSMFKDLEGAEVLNFDEIKK